MTNYNILYVLIYIWDQNNFPRVTLEPKKQRLDLGKTSYNDLVFARCEFLRFVGAPNESLRLIIR